MSASDPGREFRACPLDIEASRAFPNDRNAPSFVQEFPNRDSVTFLVTPELLQPEPAPCLRGPKKGAVVVAVPKAPVNENGDTPTCEYDVGIPRQMSAMNAKSKSRMPELPSDF